MSTRSLSGQPANRSADTHGKRSTYVKGCHCAECTAANTAYKAAWRARPRVTRPGVFESRVEGAPSWLPDPVEADDLAHYADPDCRECHGSGGTLADPCPLCIMSVWS